LLQNKYGDFDKTNRDPDFKDFDDDIDRDFDEVIYIYEYEDESKVFKEITFISVIVQEPVLPNFTQKHKDFHFFLQIKNKPFN